MMSSARRRAHSLRYSACVHRGAHSCARTCTRTCLLLLAKHTIMRAHTDNTAEHNTTQQSTTNCNTTHHNTAQRNATQTDSDNHARTALIRRLSATTHATGHTRIGPPMPPLQPHMFFNGIMTAAHRRRAGAGRPTPPTLLWLHCWAAVRPRTVPQTTTSTAAAPALSVAYTTLHCTAPAPLARPRAESTAHTHTHITVHRTPHAGTMTSLGML